MGENTAQIERTIAETRGQIGRDLQDLEAKVKHEANWRTQFERRPVGALGVGLGVGLVLAHLTTGSKPKYRAAPNREAGTSSSHQANRSSREEVATPRPNLAAKASSLKRTLAKSSVVSNQSGKLTSTVENVIGALIGVGAGRLEDYLNGIFPGFRDEYRKEAEQRTRSRANSHNQADD